MANTVEHFTGLKGFPCTCFSALILAILEVLIKVRVIWSEEDKPLNFNAKVLKVSTK